MAISHELSSEIAVAMLAAKDKSPQELRDLKDLLLKVHVILEELTAESFNLRDRSMLKTRDEDRGSIDQSR